MIGDALKRTLGSALALAVVVGACTSSHGSKTQARKPCDLLTRADASSVLDVPAERLQTIPLGRADAVAAATMCEYEYPHLPANRAGIQPGQSIPVTIVSLRYLTGERATSFFNTFKRAHPATISVSDIRGLGNDALWDGQDLMVLTDDARVEIRVEVDDAFDKPRAIKAAHLVLRALKK